MATVHLSNIKKQFGALEVIHGIDMQIDHGEFIVSQVLISSFDWRILSACARIAPHIPRGYLTQFARPNAPNLEANIYPNPPWMHGAHWQTDSTLAKLSQQLNNPPPSQSSNSSPAPSRPPPALLNQLANFTSRPHPPTRRPGLGTPPPRPHPPKPPPRPPTRPHHQHLDRQQAHQPPSPNLH